MNDVQRKRFIEVAQMGVACGLSSVWEWWDNYLLHGLSLVPYDEAAEHWRETRNAFAQFFRESSSGPEDPIERMTDEEVEAWMTRMHEATIELWREWARQEVTSPSGTLQLTRKLQP